MDNVQGNVSTIAVAVYALLAPYISQYISQEVFLAIFGLILVIWSAYHPNSFAIFGNNKTEDKSETAEEYEDVLNPEYTAGDD